MTLQSDYHSSFVKLKHSHAQEGSLQRNLGYNILIHDPEQVFGHIVIWHLNRNLWTLPRMKFAEEDAIHITYFTLLTSIHRVLVLLRRCRGEGVSVDPRVPI